MFPKLKLDVIVLLIWEEARRRKRRNVGQLI
jgi:hypothetical protein